MRPRRWWIVAGAAVLVAAAAPGQVEATDCAAGDTTCQQLQQTKQDQAGTAQRLQDIENSLAGAQAKADSTREYIAQLTGQIAAQEAVIATTQARLAETERQIRFTQAEMTRQQAHLDVRQDLLAQRVRSLDKQGSVDYLELVVTSTTFSQLVDRVTLMQEVVRGDQRLVTGLRQDRDQVRQLAQRLQAEQADEAALLQQQQDQEAQLERARLAQQDALAYYDQLEAQFAAQRDELAAEKAQIDALVGQLQDEYDAEARGVGGGSGQFSWPETGPITQPFGCTDFLGEPYDPDCPTLHFHTGIDIGRPEGTPIGAADAGVVSYVNYGWGGGYGNFVMITHGNGYTTLYAHLSAIAVSTGQAVGRRQVIGLEGTTGYSTGPHLHFEIRLNGAYENPLSYLP
jgi:murein DD-endopeptidase MepM/ murein hydrolase activator NlpD